MGQFTENDLTGEVLRYFDGIPDLRLTFVMQKQVKHWHTFVREVDLSASERLAAIRYLTDAGNISAKCREEFVLLSDTLGVSRLVELLHHRKPQGVPRTLPTA